MKIFLSSTYVDLRDTRSVAIEFLQDIVGSAKDATGEVVAMEFFAAAEDSCKEYCLQQLASCDLMIGIYGERYGSIDEETQTSLTEMEFDYAVAKGIPILAFVLNSDNREKREEEFIIKKVYARNVICAKFDGMDDFLTRLNDSLQEYLKTFEGYSFESIWNRVRELRDEIVHRIEAEGEDLLMEPYTFGQEDVALKAILDCASILEKCIPDLRDENEVVNGFAYDVKFYPERITKKDKMELAEEVSLCASVIRSNWEVINVALPNCVETIRLASMYLRLCQMQNRLLTEKWSEELRRDVIRVRDEYQKTIIEARCAD